MAAKSETVRQAYLFTGEVDARRESEVNKLVEQFLDPAFADFDLEKFDGNASSAEAIMATAMTAPLGSGRKVVIVDRVDRLDAEDQIRLALFVAKLPERTCLILLDTEDSSSKRKPGGGSKARVPGSDAAEEEGQPKRRKGLQSELLSAVKKHGRVQDFAKLKSDGLRALAADLLKQHGRRIEPMALQSLVRAVEASPSALVKEVEKLVTYAGGAAITADDVDRVVTKSADDRVFRLIDAVAARRPDEAIRHLNETFSATTKPDDEVPRILAMIGRHFRSLYQTKFLKVQGVRSVQSVPEDLQSMMARESNPLTMADWQHRKLFQQADSFSLDEIRRCLRQVLSCELAVKGIGSEGSSPRLNLEMLVLKLSQPRRKPRA